MKNTFQTPRPSKFVALAFGLVAATVFSPMIQAATVYWDTNGATPGAGVTANGTWNAAGIGNWTTNLDGTIATMNYATANGNDPVNADVIFSAGSDSTSTNVTLNGAVVAKSITVQELMNVTAATSTPSLTLGSGGLTINSTALGTTTWVSSLPTILSASQAWTNNSNYLFTDNGNITGSAVAGTDTLTIAGTGGTTLSGVIGNGIGGGTLAINVNTAASTTTLLSGNNTFTGGVTLTQGILRTGQNTATNNSLGQGTLTLAAGELQIYRPGNTGGANVGRPTTVTGSVQVTSGENSLSVGVTHTLGTLSIGGQTLTIAPAAGVTSGTSGITFGATTFTGNSIFNVTNTGSANAVLTLGALSDDGTGRTITKNGSGNLALNTAAGSLTSGGSFLIADGSVTLGNTGSTALGAYNIVLGSGAAGVTLNAGSGTITNPLTIAAGAGSRTIAYAATANTANYSGSILLNKDLTFSSASTTSNAALQVSGTITGTGNITFENTGNRTFTLNSLLDFTGNVIARQLGSGAVTVGGTNPSFAGTILADAGVVSIAITASNLNTTLAVSAGATMALAHDDHNAGGLNDGTGGGGIFSSVSGNTDILTLGGSGNYSFSGQLGSFSNLAVMKTGSGTQTFTGSAHLYGATTINAGVLLVNNTTGSGTGSGTVTVNSGGTLGGTGLIGSLTNVNGTISPGNSPGTLTINNNLNINTGSTYVFEGGDLIDVNGILDLNDNWTLSLRSGLADGGFITIFTYDSLAVTPDLVPTFDVSQLGFTPSGPLTLTDTGTSIVLNGLQVVPEPSTWALLAFSLTTVMVLRRRKQA